MPLQRLWTSDFILFLQLSDHPKIFQRRGIPFYFPPTRYLPQQAAHDFSASRLWKSVSKTDIVRLSQRTNLLRYPLLQLFLKCRSRLDSVLEAHKSPNCLPFEFIRTPNYSPFGRLS